MGMGMGMECWEKKNPVVQFMVRDAMPYCFLIENLLCYALLFSYWEFIIRTLK